MVGEEIAKMLKNYKFHKNISFSFYLIHHLNSKDNQEYLCIELHFHGDILSLSVTNVGIKYKSKNNTTITKL